MHSWFYVYFISPINWPKIGIVSGGRYTERISTLVYIKTVPFLRSEGEGAARVRVVQGG